MSGDVQVRFCESLRVRSPRATRLVICCQYNRDAERIKTAMAQRLKKYELKMNEDKTKLVKFSRRQQRQGIKQETFDFLGFVRLVRSKFNTQVILGRPA